MILDILLPGIDGLETCRRLQALRPTPFVVLCSVDEDPRVTGAALPCPGVPFSR